jgi:hypothetical protein
MFVELSSVEKGFRMRFVYLRTSTIEYSVGSKFVVLEDVPTLLKPIAQKTLLN